MYKSLVVLLILIVTVRCEFNCNSCTCSRSHGSYIAAYCNNQPHITEVLESKEIQLGANVNNLYMNEVPFKILPEYVFAKATVEKLETLYLYFCGIETIHKDAFRNLTGLKILNVAFNNVSYLSVGTFQDNWNLKELYFGVNKLEVLEDGLLATLPFLEKVSFTNNRIKQIGNNFFAPTFNLKVILLSSNLLSYINGTMLERLLKLEGLYVSNNPWKCDCKLSKFHKISLQYIQSESPDCNNTNNPKSIRERHWASLTDEDFTCEPNITLTNITALDSSSRVTVQCKITANPKPDVIVYFINQTSQQVILKENQTENDFTYIYNYEIENINSEINNTLKCYAQNNLGSAVGTIRLYNMKLKSVETGDIAIIVKIVFYVILAIFLITVCIGIWYIKFYKRNQNVEAESIEMTNRNEEPVQPEPIELSNRNDERPALYLTPITIRRHKNADIDYTDKYGNVYSRPRPDNDYEEIL